MGIFDLGDVAAKWPVCVLTCRTNSDMPYLYTIDFTPEKEFHDIAIRSIFRQLLSTNGFNDISDNLNFVFEFP